MNRIVSGMPINIFISFDPNNLKSKNELITAFGSLIRQELITFWSADQTAPGSIFKEEENENLNSCDFIFLLVSSCFISSPKCYEQARRAVERSNEGTACVIPIIIRPVDWGNSCFSHLQHLPKNIKAVSSSSDIDSTWCDIVTEIKSKINLMSNREIKKIPLLYCEDDQENKEKVIALLSQTVKDESVNLWPIKVTEVIRNGSRRLEIVENATEAIVIISHEFTSAFENNITKNRLNERIRNKELKAIPIMLDSLSSQEVENYKPNVLPSSGGAISEWSDKEEAWRNVSNGILSIILPIITDNAIEDFFKPVNNSKEYRLFPRLTNSKYIEPSFFDCICYSLREDSHVVLLHGSTRSGKSLLLAKSIFLIHSDFEKYCCAQPSEKIKLFQSLDSLDVSKRVIVIDDFEMLTPIERDVIVEYSCKVMTTQAKVLLVIVGRFKLDGPLSERIKNSDLKGLYDSYKISFSTYGSGQILQLVSDIQERFKVKFCEDKPGEIAKYSVNSLFVANFLCYEMLKNLVDIENHERTINFKQECIDIVTNLHTRGNFDIFKNLRDIFTSDKKYPIELETILVDLSSEYSRGVVSLRKTAANTSDTNFGKVISSQDFRDHIRCHISEISYLHPGFFDYEESTWQIVICHVEFLFYLKMMSIISAER